MTPNTPTTSKGWRASVEARAERKAQREFPRCLTGAESCSPSVAPAREPMRCLFIQRLGVDVFEDPTPAEVIRRVARLHGATIQQLRGSRGSRAVIAARQEIMWRLHVQHGISSTVIGRMLGGRDHTTVLHGSKAHAAKMRAAAA